MELRDRIAVVTGGASGIGAALARRFHAEGARHVVVADLDEAGAKKVAAGIGGTGVRVDVSDEAAIAQLVERTESDAGPIDLFVSNAGYVTLGGLEAPVEDLQRMFSVHVLAHLYAARAVVPRMAKRGGGHLLNTASAAGLLSQFGSLHYAVTKHAAVSLAEWIAITHGHQGIRVSVLCPQAVRTAMTADFENGGVAGVDGMIEPEAVADCTIEALDEERFLILPHPTVEKYLQNKIGDYDRWLAGMRRLRARFQPS